MRSSLICAAMMVLTGSGFAAEPDTERLQKELVSENYRVKWGKARTFNPTSELEIGSGSGHGFTLRWMRFQPGKDGVEVLSILLDEGYNPYSSKWPPDRAPVTVKSAQMKGEDYFVLLGRLAILDAATLEPVELKSHMSSSNDFWRYALLTANNKTLIDLNWAGYHRSETEIQFAKPKAASVLAQEAVKGLEFKEHTLTAGERGWASAKFIRDWEKLKDPELLYWVRERYIITIGVVGDESVLPTMRDILGGDPKDRCVYYAINAVTRLKKKDVREKPVEEMDIEKTRKKVLDLIGDEK